MVFPWMMTLPMLKLLAKIMMLPLLMLRDLMLLAIIIFLQCYKVQFILLAEEQQVKMTRTKTTKRRSKGNGPRLSGKFQPPNIVVLAHAIQIDCERINFLFISHHIFLLAL